MAELQQATQKQNKNKFPSRQQKESITHILNTAAAIQIKYLRATNFRLFIQIESPHKSNQYRPNSKLSCSDSYWVREYPQNLWQLALPTRSFILLYNGYQYWTSIYINLSKTKITNNYFKKIKNKRTSE